MTEEIKSCGELFTERLDAICKLPPDWDGYGGIPPTEETVLLAKRAGEWMMEKFGLPQIVPVCDGSIILEWHENGHDIELEVSAAND